jgi:ADP-ribose pyrophosphatase
MGQPKTPLIKVTKNITLHKGKIFNLHRETISLDNELDVNLDIIRHPGAAGIVPLSDDNTIILVKQYRHALGDFILEIPAGVINQNESPLECAKRELVEETGFSANIWQSMGPITPLPGYSDERVFMFLATELVPGKQNLDEDEILNVHEIKIDDAIDMVFAGTLQDSKTIAGLFMAEHWLDGKRL